MNYLVLSCQKHYLKQQVLVKMKQNKHQKLELTWVGKGEEPQLEPRILIENPEYSYGEKDSQNMIIHGDNLLALKALEQEYAGKVKCIYIDPPYNTGNAFEHYDDGLEHSQWLNLIAPRIKLLKNLLSEDGSLWISIDDNELHYLKIVCDEVFGRDCYLTTITWQRKYSVSNNYKGIASISEYVLVYSKSMLFKNNLLPRSADSIARYSNPDNDPRGSWKAVDYLNQATPEQRKNLCYDIVNPNTKQIIQNTKKAWKYDLQTHKSHVAENRIWWGKDGNNTVPALKLFLSEVKDGMIPHNWWPYSEVGHTDEAKKEMISLFSANNVFDTPKPERLLERILHIASDKNDLVLDSFLGSGTTAAVAHKMGRRYIGIELGNHAYTHCVPRLQKVVDGEQGGISKAVNWQGGGGFKFYELAPSLLNQDEYGNWIISKEYNPDMLAAAMAKQENFVYQPDSVVYWKQGKSTEKDFIFTTTQFVSGEMLDKLHNGLSADETLLICATSFAKGLETRYSNIKLRKIPLMLLGRCEFGKDDYSLNIINLPTVDDDSEDDEITEDNMDNACDNNPNELF